MGLDVFKDLMKQAEDDAKASMGYSNFGRFGIDPDGYVYFYFQDKDPRYVEMSLEEYKNHPAAGKSRRRVKVKFTIDVRELKPDFEHDCFDTIEVGGQDWRETWLPSVMEVMGVDRAGATDAISELQGKYVYVRSIPRKYQKAGADRIWNTFKLMAVYKNKAECVAARNEMFGTDGDVEVERDTSMPAGYEDMERFESDVEDLRSEGFTPEEIAQELGVDVSFVS